MSSIIFTHARSGSTFLQSGLDVVNTIKSNKNLNLGEFFNVHCKETFMDLPYILRTRFTPIIDEIIAKNKPTFQTLALQEDIFNIENADELFEGDNKSIELLYHHFNTVDITWTNTQDAREQFISKEIGNRIKFLQLLTTLNSSYTVKHFIVDDFDFEFGNLLIDLDTDNIFHYRKDIIGAIFSSLIKMYYIDEPNLLGSYNIPAHNYGNMQPIQPVKHLISTKRILSKIQPFINILKFYQTNRSKFDIVTNYEDLLVNQLPVKLDSESSAVKLSELVIGNRFGIGANKVEHPMPYTNDKLDYFINADEVIEQFQIALTENQLLDVVNELDIQIA
jgi:hypothetical protein